MTAPAQTRNPGGGAWNSARRPGFFTFAYELNVGGQWIAAWVVVQAQIDSDGAGQSGFMVLAGEQCQRVTG
jgi:hypothetical protein